MRQDTQDDIDRYRDHGVLPGSFLQAVLENDLVRAFQQADEDNGRGMAQIVGYCYNHLPGGSWKSPERVREWAAHKGLAGLQHECNII